MQSTSGNAGLDEAQVGIKIAGRNINNLTYVDDISITAQSEEFKSLLMRVKEESEIAVLKLNTEKNEEHGIRSNHFMANRQENNGNSDRLLFSWAPMWTVTAAMKLKDSLEEKL